MGGEGERGERKPFGGRGGRGGRDGERGGDRGDYRRRDAGGEGKEGKEGAPSGEFAPQLYVYINSLLGDDANFLTAVDSVVVLDVEEPHQLLKFAQRLRLLLCSFASTSTETTQDSLKWLGWTVARLVE